MKLRRKMIAGDGPGWAVTSYEDRILPGRWETEADATNEGLLGVYLFSGMEVQEIKRLWRRTKLGDGWWQVYGRGELRHEVFGTVEKVYGEQWFAATGMDTRTYRTLTEACQWVADQFKPSDK